MCSLAVAVMWIRDRKASEQHVQDTDSFTLIRLMSSLPPCTSGKVRKMNTRGFTTQTCNLPSTNKLELRSHSKIYWT